jgi:hypothetical protein
MNKNQVNEERRHNIYFVTKEGVLKSRACVTAMTKKNIAIGITDTLL